jgi:hypothetical protein
MNSVLSSTRRHTTFLGFPAMKSVLMDHPELNDLRALKTQAGGMTIYLCPHKQHSNAREPCFSVRKFVGP